MKIYSTVRKNRLEKQPYLGRYCRVLRPFSVWGARFHKNPQRAIMNLQPVFQAIREVFSSLTRRKGVIPTSALGTPHGVLKYGLQVGGCSLFV